MERSEKHEIGKKAHMLFQKSSEGRTLNPVFRELIIRSYESELASHADAKSELATWRFNLLYFLHLWSLLDPIMLKTC